MNMIEIISRKRDGFELSKEQINFVITGYTASEIPDYQISSLLMAIYLRGMNKEETAELTKAMLYSGEILDFSSVKETKIGKHSTGGVGDKTSLILAPIVALAGVAVPQITGRGLGHTGGTLDKLESIPGFRAQLPADEFVNVVKTHGAVLTGQTDNIAPADKLIYALRDASATVASIPLITASIMSKKIAEGSDGIVFDIKTGSGAFMRTLEGSRSLAKSLIDTAKAFDKKVLGFITEMSQPLGRKCGNWSEILEVLEVLQGEDIKDLNEVTLTLSGAMIYLGGKASNLEEGIEIATSILKSGKAFDKFLDIVNAQGGDISYLKETSKYKKPLCTEAVYAERGGFVADIDSYRIGMELIELGGGRFKKEDIVDPLASIEFYPKIGDFVREGSVIGKIETNRPGKINNVYSSLIESISLQDTKVAKPKMIKEILD